MNTHAKPQESSAVQELFFEIRRGEWIWVLVASSLILILSTLPYLAAYRAQSPGWVFNGAVFDRQDYAVHLATMHLGERGEWTYRVRFTAEAQQGAYVKLGYIFLGHAARWLGMDLALSYQLGRVFFGLLACLAIYVLSACFFRDLTSRRLAFLLAVCGSGLGFLQLIFGWLPRAEISPVDFWLIDAYVFFGLMVLPHFSVVTALLAGSIAAFLSFLDRPVWWKWLLVVVSCLLVQMIQPYTPLLADFAMLGALLARTRKCRLIDRLAWTALTGIGLAQLPLLIYNLAVFRSDSLWQNFTAQNITLSPPPIYYLLGFGALWPLALLGTWAAVRDPQENRWMALAWTVGALALAYSPLAMQRRFMHAFSIPLAFLAIYGLREVIFPWMNRYLPARLTRIQGSLAVLLVAFACLSSIYLSLGNSLYLLSRPASLFDPVSLVIAVDWLGKNARPEDIVLSSELTGQLVAARAGLPAYLGHPIETLDYSAKTNRVKNLFSGAEPVDWLQASGVEWVVYGPREQELNGGRGAELSLPVAYQNEMVTIYQVTP